MPRTLLARPGPSHTSPHTSSVRPPMRSRPHVLLRRKARARPQGDSSASGSVTSSRRRFASSCLTTSVCGTTSAGQRLTAERASGSAPSEGPDLPLGARCNCRYGRGLATHALTRHHDVDAADSGEGGQPRGDPIINAREGSDGGHIGAAARLRALQLDPLPHGDVTRQLRGRSRRTVRPARRHHASHRARSAMPLDTSGRHRPRPFPRRWPR